MSNSYGSQYPSGYPNSSQGQTSSGYYYPVPQQANMRSSPYPGHPNSSSGMPPRPSTHPQPGRTPSSEQPASKRRRPASMDPAASAQMQGQWGTQGTAYASHAHAHGHGAQMHPSSSAARRSSPTNTHSRRGSDEPEDEDQEPLDHGPTEFPPRTYQGQSKYNPRKKPGKIPGSAMDYLPILEARFDRLETAIDRYVDYRGQRALSNSILPGSSSSQQGHSSRR